MEKRMEERKVGQQDLTGKQRVLIPASNKKQLKLRRDVLEATEKGQFHIYAVSTIDEGIEILTGQPAGERGDGEDYPEGSINQRVEARLRTFSDQAKAFRRPAQEENS